MTVRQMRLQRRREIKRNNMQKWLFRNAVKVLLVTLVELVAAGFILLVQKDQWMVSAWQMMFFFAVGVVTAFWLWKE